MFRHEPEIIRSRNTKKNNEKFPPLNKIDCISFVVMETFNINFEAQLKAKLLTANEF